MKVKTEELKAAFAVIDNVAVNPVLETSQFVRIRQDGDKLMITLTGSLWAESTIKGVTNGGKWTEYADRRLLKAFMSSCSGVEVDIVLKPKEKLTFKAGQRLEIASHAIVPGYESWVSKPSSDLTTETKAALACAVKYLPLNMAGTEKMNGVWFGKDMMMATDSVSMVGFYGVASKSDFVMPAETSVFLASNDAKVCPDADGVGATLKCGYVYQQCSTQLNAYPYAAARQQMDAALKAKPVLTLMADELLNALGIAAQFMLDKSEACTFESKGGALQLSVDMAAGRFERAVKADGTLDAPVGVALKRLMPWLEYAGSAKVEYAKLANCSMLRFIDKKQKNILLVADV